MGVLALNTKNVLTKLSFFSQITRGKYVSSERNSMGREARSLKAKGEKFHRQSQCEGDFL